METPSAGENEPKLPLSAQKGGDAQGSVASPHSDTSPVTAWLPAPLHRETGGSGDSHGFDNGQEATPTLHTEVWQTGASCSTLWTLTLPKQPQILKAERVPCLP